MNVRGGAFRDIGAFDASKTSFERSLVHQLSARYNPMAYVGLAATLRRTGQWDEAYTAIKKARRWYPDDPYVLRVLAALDRDRDPESARQPA